MTESLSFDQLSKLFHLPLSDAAKEIGICCTALKKACRKNNIHRWPHRKVKSLDRMIETLEAKANESPNAEEADKVHIELEYYKNQRALIMKNSPRQDDDPFKIRTSAISKHAGSSSPSSSSSSSSSSSPPPPSSSSSGPFHAMPAQYLPMSANFHGLPFAGARAPSAAAAVAVAAPTDGISSSSNSDSPSSSPSEGVYQSSFCDSEFYDGLFSSSSDVAPQSFAVQDEQQMQQMVNMMYLQMEMQKQMAQQQARAKQQQQQPLDSTEMPEYINAIIHDVNEANPSASVPTTQTNALSQSASTPMQMPMSMGMPMGMHMPMGMSMPMAMPFVHPMGMGMGMGMRMPMPMGMPMGMPMQGMMFPFGYPVQYPSGSFSASSAAPTAMTTTTASSLPASSSPSSSSSSSPQSAEAVPVPQPISFTSMTPEMSPFSSFSHNGDSFDLLVKQENLDGHFAEFAHAF